MGMQSRGDNQEISACPEFDDWLVIEKKNKRVTNNALFSSAILSQQQELEQ